MRGISITVDLMFRLKVLIINESKDTHHKCNCTFYIVEFFIGSDTMFLADFRRFSERGYRCVSQ